MMAGRRINVMTAVSRMVAAAWLATVAGAGEAPDEVHSNGYGGGPWRDPATWHGDVVPTAGQHVIIAAGDTVVYDGGQTDESAAGRLTVDPRAVLTFDDRGVQVLDIGGPLICYGLIRMDASRRRAGRMELRLTGEGDDARRIQLMQRAGILVYGRPGRSAAERTAVLAAGVQAATDAAPLRIVAGTAERRVAGEAMMLDIHHARLDNVVVEAARIDNTGAYADQRVNLLNNEWTGASRMILRHCDTPFVHFNRMRGEPADPADESPFILLSHCQLADVRGNRLQGPRAVGIAVQDDIDSSMTDNHIEGCRTGIAWHGRNAMLKDLLVADAVTGVSIDQASGVLESATIRGASETAVRVRRSEMQLTDLRIEDRHAEAAGLRLDAATVTLLNADIEPDTVVIVNPPAAGQPAVQRMEYLFVAVRGRVPANAMVAVGTAEVSGRPKPGQADLNVRNSPARLVGGVTPRPRGLQPLIVRSWRIERDGRLREAPFYDVRVIQPATEPDQPPTVLHEQIVEPADTWYRPVPNDGDPMIEIRLR